MAPAKTVLLVLRYSVFALFVACNAIVCCAAVWDLGLAETVGYTPRVDIYLVVLSTLGLAFIIPIVFIDIFVRHAFTGRVWFEGVWVGLFCLLELVGAAILAAEVPVFMCTPESERIAGQSCVATNMLQAFTWFCTAILLVYFITLVVYAICHQDYHEDVWHSGVRDFPWFSTSRTSLNSPPPPRVVEQKLPPAEESLFAAPRPRRLASLRNAVLSWRAGLSGEYQADGVYTASPRPPSDRPLAPVAEAMPERQPSPSALYPEHVQLALKAVVWDKPEQAASQPPGRRRSSHSRPIRELPVPAAVAPAPEPPVASSSKSPLGDWPRPDILQQPPRAKRKPPVPPSAFPSSIPAEVEAESHRSSLERGSAEGRSAPPSPRTSLSTGRPAAKPGGPRARTPSVSSVASAVP